uniref:Uncharacterized protein n=1 Tax=Oryza brachyantha TaxID=4533 RepID=J3M936_ORYBR
MWKPFSLRSCEDIHYCLPSEAFHLLVFEAEDFLFFKCSNREQRLSSNAQAEAVWWNETWLSRTQIAYILTNYTDENFQKSKAVIS